MTDPSLIADDDLTHRDRLVGIRRVPYPAGHTDGPAGVVYKHVIVICR